jgi:hypothetical protein
MENAGLKIGQAYSSAGNAVLVPRNSASSAGGALNDTIDRLRRVRERTQNVVARVTGDTPQNAEQPRSKTRPLAQGIFAAAVDRCDDMNEEITYIEAAVAALEDAVS